MKFNRLNMFTSFYIILFLVIVVSHAFGMSYQSREYNYSFVIPSGWEEIPKQILDESSERIASVTGTKKINYETGFQIVGKNNLEPPYIVIPILPQYGRTLPPDMLEQLYKIYTSKDFSSTVEEKFKSFSNFLSSPSFDLPYVDKEKKMIVMSMKGNYSGKNMRTLLAQFVGKRTIVQINFVVLESDYHKYIPVFESLISSFKFDEPLIPQEYKRSIVDKAIPNIIAGIILALTASAYFGIRNWIKRKKLDCTPSTRQNMEVPVAQRTCPNCSLAYKVQDYRADVPTIYCASCGSPLPR
jgi:hypothetical protein